MMFWWFKNHSWKDTRNAHTYNSCNIDFTFVDKTRDRFRVLGACLEQRSSEFINLALRRTRSERLDSRHNLSALICNTLTFKVSININASNKKNHSIDIIDKSDHYKHMFSNAWHTLIVSNIHIIVDVKFDKSASRVKLSQDANCNRTNKFVKYSRVIESNYFVRRTKLTQNHQDNHNVDETQISRSARHDKCVRCDEHDVTDRRSNMIKSRSH